MDLFLHSKTAKRWLWKANEQPRSFLGSIQVILKRLVDVNLRREPVAGAAANFVVIGYSVFLVQTVCLTPVGFLYDLTSVVSLSSASLVGISILVYGASDLAFESSRRLAIRLRILAGVTMVVAGVWALFWAGYFAI